jgi:hypothetical protein
MHHHHPALARLDSVDEPVQPVALDAPVYQPYPASAYAGIRGHLLSRR